MNTINVTVELCQEDRERLDLLTSVLIDLGGELKQHNAPTLMMSAAPTEEPAAPAEEPAAPASAADTAAAETGHPAEEVAAAVEPEPAAEPEQPKYTKEDVQALVRKLAAPNSPEHKRTGAKAIVKAYGAKVSDIPEDKYAEAMDKLTKLDQEG